MEEEISSINKKKSFFKPFIELLQKYKIIFFALILLLLLVVAYSTIQQSLGYKSRAGSNICALNNFSECKLIIGCIWKNNRCIEDCRFKASQNTCEDKTYCSWSNIEGYWRCYFDTELETIATITPTITPTSGALPNAVSGPSCSLGRQECNNNQNCIWLKDRNSCEHTCSVEYEFFQRCDLSYCTMINGNCKLRCKYFNNQGACYNQIERCRWENNECVNIPSCKTTSERCLLPNTQSNCCSGLWCNRTSLGSYLCGTKPPRPSSTPQIPL